MVYSSCSACNNADLCLCRYSSTTNTRIHFRLNRTIPMRTVQSVLLVRGFSKMLRCWLAVEDMLHDGYDSLPDLQFWRDAEADGTRHWHYKKKDHSWIPTFANYQWKKRFKWSWWLLYINSRSTTVVYKEAHMAQVPQTILLSQSCHSSDDHAWCHLWVVLSKFYAW